MIPLTHEQKFLMAALWRTVKQKEKNRRYRVQNPEKIKELKRRWERENHEKKREYRERTRAKHPTAHRDGARRSYERHRERICAKQRQWQADHRDMARAQKLKTAYGISSEDFSIWLTAQDHRCRICKTDKPGGAGQFHVDHCHDTQKLRGLLCARCNTLLGYAKDNPNVLRAAAAYLERTKTAKHC